MELRETAYALLKVFRAVLGHELERVVAARQISSLSRELIQSYKGSQHPDERDEVREALRGFLSGYSSGELGEAEKMFDDFSGKSIIDTFVRKQLLEKLPR